MSAFDSLHVGIREAIWRQKWEQLRPLQVAAIRAVQDGKNHIILSAATASGKTEAAFLPILSRIAESPSPGIQALYVSPLKALINDQFQRLEFLCKDAQIPVHRWHGDVGATEKRRLKEAPGGVLLITPESLESQFINHNRHLQRIYCGLEFVVVDELHAFLEDVRGMHLRSLVCRLKHATGAKPRMLGLSATLGDFGPAKRFLCRETPERVEILQDAAGERQLRVAIKAFQRPASEAAELIAERGIARDIATRFGESTNLVFCNSRSLTEEIADLLNERCREENWPRNPFRVHHGSLSRELREDAEGELKMGTAVTVLCTRTLEMGIDIGAVKSVGQIGAPWSAASLAQRVGRSGRREGESQILRVYSIDTELSEKSSVTERLFPDLLRSIATVELLRRRWAEPPKDGRRHYSTLIHQLLSVLRQTGGTRADHAFKLLCSEGAFFDISGVEFAQVMRGLSGHNIVQQIETGEIILAPEGERIVEARDFYAAFISSIDYSIEHGAEKIGLMPRGQVPPIGEHLILGGRRWCVADIDHLARRVSVVPARGRKKPLFLGGGGVVAREVMIEMERLISCVDALPYLHESASTALDSARRIYRELGLVSLPVWETSQGVWLLPWQGSVIHETLKLCAISNGLSVEVSVDGLGIRYKGLSKTALREHLKMVADGDFDAKDLAEHVVNAELERFDGVVPPKLLLEAFVQERLDLAGARHAAQNLLDSMAKLEPC